MTASRRTWVAALLGLTLTVAGCGSSGHHDLVSGPRRNAAARPRARHAAPVGPERLTYRTLFALPAPLRDPATAPVGSSQAALLGGLDSADVSTSEIDVISPHGVSYTGALPVAQHDAQAATLAGQVYVFGGGGLTELNHIVGFDPGGHGVRSVGVLPSASSDVAVTQVGDTAYIVGGYDGTSYLNTILAWHPGVRRRWSGTPRGSALLGRHLSRRQGHHHRRFDPGRSQPGHLQLRSATGRSRQSVSCPNPSRTAALPHWATSSTSSVDGGIWSRRRPRAYGRSIPAPERSSRRAACRTPSPTRA